MNVRYSDIGATIGARSGELGETFIR
jgi:hypothetical protein